MAFKRITAALTDITVDMAGNWAFKLQSPAGYPKLISASASYGGPTVEAGDSFTCNAAYTVDQTDTYSEGKNTPVQFLGYFATARTLPEDITVIVEMVWATTDETVAADGYGGTIL